ncbi:MAG: tyrosine-type recombinase/integrase [Peptococcaceae bacterium]|nr:tyrosine-type recombinase/integrase [Peptococcaceae bacterium]
MMAVTATKMAFIDIFRVYAKLFKKHLSADCKRYIFKFAQLLDELDLGAVQSSFGEIDNFLINTVETLPEPLQDEIIIAAEYFCNYLVSRGKLQANPFFLDALPTMGNGNTEQNETPLKIVPKNSGYQATCKEQKEAKSFEEIAEPVFIPERVTSYESQENFPPNSYEEYAPANNISTLRELMELCLYERQFAGRTISKSTVQSYSTDYNQFYEFLVENGFPTDLATFNERCIVHYLEHIQKLYAPTSFSHKKASLRALFHFAENENHLKIKRNWANDLYINKKEKTQSVKHYRPLGLEEQDTLLAYVRTQTLKQQLEILLPLLVTLRRSEAVPLQVHNFHFASGILHITKSKGGVMRDVPLPTFVSKIVQLYIKENNLTENDYLFPSAKPTSECKHMNPNTFTNHVKATAKNAGLTKTVTAHELRATFATNYANYASDMNIIVLQEVMGHDDLNTTRSYIGHISKDKNKPTLEDLYAKWEALFCEKNQED